MKKHPRFFVREIHKGSSWKSTKLKSVRRPRRLPKLPLRLHPRNSLPRSGVSLHSIAVSHPTAPKLQAAYDAIGLSGIAITTGPANLSATLRTPKGLVMLESLGL